MIRMIILVALALSVTGCEHLNKIKVSGEVVGSRYSKDPFAKGKHVITARYPLSNTINIKGTSSQPFTASEKLDAGLPDYGETSVEILF